ncbi:hypothetical protein CC80DRAFT_495478 [Byssothecium circinans]|uniref:Ig-like domain-containing protein n=1 Tax=Byssothecium circinans TaxID=147558 RepID=A0A6A5TK98_9PLEO|nr:hypothetical protein CC80DRAFT_495478 [Byssothecium circinans]
MKLFTVSALLLCPYVLANPVPDVAPLAPTPAPSENGTVSVMATCYMISPVIEGCDYDPFHAERRRDFPVGLQFYPPCQITNGRSHGNPATRTWVWAGSLQKCWIGSANTNFGCEAGMPLCDGLGSDG